MVDKELLEILACPKCKKPVREEPPAVGEDVQAWLVCANCAVGYPIREDIPIMLIDEAVPRGKRPS